jgi:hypothetical protein
MKSHLTIQANTLKRNHLCMLLFMCMTTIHAQERTVIIADVESHVPIPRVLIYLKSGEHIRTNLDGAFILQTDSFGELTLKHPKYLTRIVTPEETHTDTLFLIPTMNSLHEVVIYGQRKDKETKLKQFNQPFYEGDPLLKPAQPTGMDILGFFNLAEKKRKKRGEKVKRTLENY